jgi:hypothetical protein
MKKDIRNYIFKTKTLSSIKEKSIKSLPLRKPITEVVAEPITSYLEGKIETSAERKILVKFEKLLKEYKKNNPNNRFTSDLNEVSDYIFHCYKQLSPLVSANDISNPRIVNLNDDYDFAECGYSSQQEFIEMKAYLYKAQLQLSKKEAESEERLTISVNSRISLEKEMLKLIKFEANQNRSLKNFLAKVTEIETKEQDNASCFGGLTTKDTEEDSNYFKTNYSLIGILARTARTEGLLSTKASTIQTETLDESYREDIPEESAKSILKTTLSTPVFLDSLNSRNNRKCWR